MGLLRIASTARTCATSLLIKQASSSASTTGAMVDRAAAWDEDGGREEERLACLLPVSWKEMEGRNRDYMSKIGKAWSW